MDRKPEAQTRVPSVPIEIDLASISRQPQPSKTDEHIRQPPRLAPGVRQHPRLLRPRPVRDADQPRAVGGECPRERHRILKDHRAAGAVGIDAHESDISTGPDDERRVRRRHRQPADSAATSASPPVPSLRNVAASVAGRLPRRTGWLPRASRAADDSHDKRGEVNRSTVIRPRAPRMPVRRGLPQLFFRHAQPPLSQLRSWLGFRATGGRARPSHRDDPIHRPDQPAGLRRTSPRRRALRRSKGPMRCATNSPSRTRPRSPVPGAAPIR